MNHPQESVPHATIGPVVSHDYSPSPRARRRLHAASALVLGGALLTSAALQLAHDRRPLDEQLGGALRHAGDTLQQWQAQLARGLQVSLRAVADGRETPDQAVEHRDRAVSTQAPLPQRR